MGCFARNTPPALSALYIDICVSHGKGAKGEIISPLALSVLVADGGQKKTAGQEATFEAGGTKEPDADGAVERLQDEILIALVDLAEGEGNQSAEAHAVEREREAKA